MTRKTSLLLTLSVIVAFLISCGQNNNKANIQNKNPESYAESKEPEICDIKGEEIPLRVGAGENFDKLINKKATEMLNETQYATVDYSVKVIVEEEKGDWSKIKVVEPEHLSASHIGWIPTKNIIKKSKANEQAKLEKLETSVYEIIKTKQNATVKNYYVLIKYSAFDKDKVREFIEKFRNEFCSNSSNVYIYDTKSISSLIDKYPLEKKEYLLVADHFVAMSSFDAPSAIGWYPYQDFQYKEYGGKNWNKEPIK